MSVGGFGAGKYPTNWAIDSRRRSCLALVGLLYPMLINSFDQTSALKYSDDTLQKSQICKSLVIFIGINHLCAVR